MKRYLEVAAAVAVAAIGLFSMFRIVAVVVNALEDTASDTRFAILTALALSLVGAGLVITALATDPSNMSGRSISSRKPAHSRISSRSARSTPSRKPAVRQRPTKRKQSLRL